jgi:hypothetical protein
MAIPNIPGYTTKATSIADVFSAPPGSYSSDLWPDDYLQSLSPVPTGWVVVLEDHDGPGEGRSGVSSVLVDREHLAGALAAPSWSGSGLGSAGAWEWNGELQYADGLTTEDFGVETRFFAQFRDHHGLASPTLEVHQPVLWYFDAVPRGEGWATLDEGGREHDLIRVVRDASNYSVQIDAAQLRRFLAASGTFLLTQHDLHRYSDTVPSESVGVEHRSEVACLDWHAGEAFWRLGDSKPGHARLLGKVAVVPIDGSPLVESHGGPYEEFIIGVDDATGAEVRQSCDPDLLGTYFDGPDRDAVHGLTPAYFRLEVLARYVSEPTRYRVTRTELSCLGLWGMDCCRNSEDLVEVYLSDLGKRLPRSERPHWLSFNVPPKGTMDEGRFRRDFLAQPASTFDPVHDLLTVVRNLDAAFVSRWGQPLWTPLVNPLATEFAHLYGPVTDDPSALLTPIVTMTKALIDSLSLPTLRSATGETDKSVQSLALLQQLVGAEGGSVEAIVSPLRSLQAIRSKGQAHRSDSSRIALFADLGLTGLTTPRQFDAICERTTAALGELLHLIEPPEA